MTTSTATKGAAPSAADLRTELLDRLGLGPDANDQEIESAHRELTAYLDSAPTTLGGWAAGEAGRADEAFALLTGPESALQAAARERYAARVRARVAAPAAGATAAAPHTPSRLPWYLLAAVAVAAIIVGVWWAGRPTSVPEMTAAQSSASAAATAAPTMDPAKLAGLMAKIEANPKDVASLQQVSDLYFQVQDYKNAATFSQKVLDVEPTNLPAMLSLGAAQFNQGDQAGAEKTWTAAAAANPENQEVHYDLGFLYMTQGKSEQMQAEWAKVLAIDPTSDLAKTVSSHMGSSTSPSPTTSTSK